MKLDELGNGREKQIFPRKFPILEPMLTEEKIGMVQSVVFPTGIDRRDDLGSPQQV